MQRTVVSDCARGLAFALSMLVSPPRAQASKALDDLDPSEQRQRAPRRFGLMFDVGSVEGGMLSLALRPTDYLRLEGGAGTNAVSPGFRLGAVALLPGSWPTLSLSGGHFFEGDINGVARAFSLGAYRHNPRLEHFDYDFVSLQLGWETEAAGLIFFAQGGASLLWSELPVQSASAALPGAAVVRAEPEPFWLLLPSLRLGFIGLL